MAIIITIMVLELKAPHGATAADLIPLLPVILSYVLSFVYVAIYWNNHHHMFQATAQVGGAVLWANMHLLFWLSLFPFVTDWMGTNHFAPIPTALYGSVLLMASVAYWILQTAVITQQGSASMLAKAIGRDVKGKLSPILYAVAIASAFLHVAVSQLLYVCVALIWLVPDRRIERMLAHKGIADE
jgi:uncharacterized membrane protein